MNRWIDVPRADGTGLAAILRVGAWDVEVRTDKPTGDALYARQLDGRQTRGVYAWRVLPACLGHLIAAIPETKVVLAEHAPHWRDWWLEERARHETRKARLIELAASCGRGNAPAQLSLTRSIFDDLIAEVASLPGADMLKDYQRVGVAWARLACGRLIWNDDMGLGKTVQVLFWLHHEPGVRRVLIVAPASVQINWKVEAQRWAPRLRVHTPSGSRKLKATLSALDDGDALVVTWGLLHRNLDALSEAGFDTIVADEAHNAQSVSAQRTSALLKLCHLAERRVLPTGTKIRSRPREVWTLLHAIDPFGFDRFRVFGEIYCGPKNQRRRDGSVIRTYTGRSRLPELNLTLRGYANRRTKAQVLPQLPEKRIQLLRVGWPSKKLEREHLALQDRLDAIADAEPDAEVESPLGILVSMRKLAGQAKIVAAVDWIAEAHKNDEPVVVFIYHHEVRLALEAALDKLKLRRATIAGDTAKVKRQRICEAFQAGRLDVVIGSEAMKEGVTLTRAAFTLHVERWWIPGDEDQAVDRIYRIGQGRSTLSVFLHLKGSVDDQVVAVITDKRKTIEAVNDRTPLTSEILRRLQARVMR